MDVGSNWEDDEKVPLTCIAVHPLGNNLDLMRWRGVTNGPQSGGTERL